MLHTSSESARYGNKSSRASGRDRDALENSMSLWRTAYEPGAVPLRAHFSSACSPEVAVLTTSSPSRSASSSLDVGRETKALLPSSSLWLSCANSSRSFSYWGSRCPVASRRRKALGDPVVGLADLLTLSFTARDMPCRPRADTGYPTAQPRQETARSS